MEDFRLRQVHLDFHTSPNIPDIGVSFDKEEWQSALKDGHINSITVFSKCHHGYSFHPSKVNEMHPNLKFDLLGAQLEACKEIGVNAPVYISAGLDEKDALAHPEWLQRNKNDVNDYGNFTENPRFHLMCLNTAYLDKLLAEIDEVMSVYNPCGIFLDILFEHPCWCAKCRADMTALGLDYTNDADAEEFGRQVYRNYLNKVEAVVRKHSKTASIFHNSGHILKGRRDLLDTMEHLELESLPTGGWGYDHFPMSASYARTLNKPFLGMTGKFHQSWGEFGGFKHPNALIYEASLSLAMGAGCSIGDQMHPCGKLNPSTYKLIGAAYSEVEKKEPWCIGAKNIADIAVLGHEAITRNRNCEKSSSDVGANRILLETHRLYNFIDEYEDFSKYKLIILPDGISASGEFRKKIKEFAANGGKLLLSGKSCLDDDNDFFVDAGIKFRGENEFEPNYMIPDFDTVNGKTEYVIRSKSYLFDNIDAEVIANAQNPYFNRTVHHFCSHQHAPNDESCTYPAAVIKNNIAYIGWDIFGVYGKSGDLHIKELVNYVLTRLMSGESSVTVKGLPDRGVVSLTKHGNRSVVHLLFAHTSIRGENIEVIEDIVPIYDIEVKVKADKPSRVYLAPEMTDIDFTYENGEVSFTVPKVYIHQMICID
ncbi:MAG: alpha-L-fucosidase [Clostridia bacterium]|nr:alpha-L-fucosidase [Clostridia bacterium]